MSAPPQQTPIAKILITKENGYIFRIARVDKNVLQLELPTKPHLPTSQDPQFATPEIRDTAYMAAAEVAVSVSQIQESKCEFDLDLLGTRSSLPWGMNPSQVWHFYATCFVRVPCSFVAHPENSDHTFYSVANVPEPTVQDIIENGAKYLHITLQQLNKLYDDHSVSWASNATSDGLIYQLLRKTAGDLHMVKKELDHVNAEDATGLFGITYPVEYARGVEFVPIHSNTAPPFDKTNIVVFKSDKEALLVDPGSNEKGQHHLEALLLRLKEEGVQELRVFLTHHHHDHVEQLPLLKKHFNNVALVAHPYSFEKLGEKANGFVVVALDPNSTVTPIPLGDFELEVLLLPGHTKGHCALHEKRTSILMAGDHVVGYGSTLVDFSGGGSMRDYLESTEYLLALNPNIILPCHGAAIVGQSKLLFEKYILHRLEREKQLIALYRAGNVTMQSLLETAYGTTPQNLWRFAKNNILVHFQKLQEDNLFTQAEFEALIESNK